MTKIHLGILFIINLLLLSCVKDGANIIPDVPVNFSIPINDPRISRLNSAGGAVIINGYGYAGLILYKRPDGVIVAYDRCSSVNPVSKCQLTLGDPTIIANDPCSGAIFLLSDGSPAKAPATRPLKQYLVTVTSFQISVLN
jgi:nitrite reductase/ring-hydroxylating ferredoxin subunit